MENSQRKHELPQELEALLNQAIQTGKRVPIWRSGRIVAEILPLRKRTDTEADEQSGYLTVGETLVEFLRRKEQDKG